MNDETDLSAGSVPPDKQALLARLLREEDQRLRWKTAVLWGSAAGIVVFYLALFGFIVCVGMCWVDAASSNLIVGILAAVPSLLAINLFRLVGKPNTQQEDDFERSPWFSLAKELVDAIKTK